MEIRKPAAVAALVVAVVLVGLGIFVVFVALTTSRAGAAESRWNRWNVAPYALSQEEACRKAPAAIDGFTIPPAVKEHFKQVLGTACKGGEKVWLTPDMSLKQMWSGGRRPHVTDNVTVGELPVLKSPDGRPYRKGSVAETAAAFQWAFVHEGKTYLLYLPFVCFNWSWAYGPPPAPIEKCVEFSFNALVGGKVRWGVGTTTGPLPPDECNAQRQDDGPWTAWYGECDECMIAVDHFLNILSPTVRIPHKYLYPVTARRQTLRFSTSVWNSVVYICLEDANGVQSCGVYMRPQDWNGRYRVEIPDSMWVWGEENCPK